jgi:hypothetical protein
VSAFFEADDGAGFEQGTALTITLSNRSKKKTANLGRFRLSVTSSKNPVSLPDSVRAILALAPIAAAPITSPSWQLITVPSRRSLETFANASPICAVRNQRL